LWTPERGSSGTLRIEIRPLGEPGAEGEGATLSFVSYDLLHKVLAPKRMAIVRTMMGAGPLSIREIARRVGRDFKGVHSDVSGLLQSGVLYRAEGGMIVFPFDRLHFEFSVAEMSAA
jgi:predicted transcriptional regulator